MQQISKTNLFTGETHADTAHNTIQSVQVLEASTVLVEQNVDIPLLLAEPSVATPAKQTPLRIPLRSARKLSHQDSPISLNSSRRSARDRNNRMAVISESAGPTDNAVSDSASVSVIPEENLSDLIVSKHDDSADKVADDKSSEDTVLEVKTVDDSVSKDQVSEDLIPEDKVLEVNVPDLKAVNTDNQLAEENVQEINVQTENISHASNTSIHNDSNIFEAEDKSPKITEDVISTPTTAEGLVEETENATVCSNEVLNNLEGSMSPPDSFEQGKNTIECDSRENTVANPEPAVKVPVNATPVKVVSSRLASAQKQPKTSPIPSSSSVSRTPSTQRASARKLIPDVAVASPRTPRQRNPSRFLADNYVTPGKRTPRAKSVVDSVKRNISTPAKVLVEDEDKSGNFIHYYTII